MSLLDKLTINDLDEEQRELAECIGLDAYKKLLHTYAGSSINVRMPKRITIPIRDREIRSRFNGYNYGALAREYDLSEASVRRIVAPELLKIKLSPCPDQTTFFDGEK